MILTLTASIMYWSLQQPVEESESSPAPSSRGASPVPSIDDTPTNGAASPAFAATPDASPVLLPVEGSLSSTAADSHEASPAPSGVEDNSSIVSEISQLTVDDTSLDPLISAQADDPPSDAATSALPAGNETQKSE